MGFYFAENLRFLRRRKGVTQSELSAHMNKAHTTIGNWEKKHSKPSIEELLELTRYFNVSVSDLLEKDLSKLVEQKIESSQDNEVNHLKNGTVWNSDTMQQYTEIQKKYIELLQEENKLLKQLVKESELLGVD